jgi:hypothetical protein
MPPPNVYAIYHRFFDVRGGGNLLRIPWEASSAMKAQPWVGRRRARRRQLPGIPAGTGRRHSAARASSALAGARQRARGSYALTACFWSLLMTWMLRGLAAAALTLAGSLVPTTVAGHGFWTISDPVSRQQQRAHFDKNLAIFGGLLAAAAIRPARRRGRL